MIASSSLAAFSATNIPASRPAQTPPAIRPDLTGVRQARATVPQSAAPLPTSPPAQAPPRGSLLNLSV